MATGLKTTMKQILLSAFLILLINNTTHSCEDSEVYPNKMFPEVLIKTTQGDVLIELNRTRAPMTVNNFLQYVKNGSYINTIFHRVENNFVIQGGGYNKEIEEIKTCKKIFNESGNGLKNTRGTIAMARYDDPHSASSQFYFNLVDSPSLDPNRKNWGYTVFGEVIEGMEVLDAISNVKTGFSERLNSASVPLVPIIIQSIEVK